MKAMLFKVLIFLQDKLLYIINSIFIALAPIAHLFIIMFIFVSADFITGIIKSKKNKIPITSKRLRDSVVKMIVYAILIIVFHLFDLYFCQPLWGINILFRVAIFIIGSIEVISINENITEILGVDILSRIKTFFSENKGKIDGIK